MVMKYRKNWYPDIDPERDNYNMHILDATNEIFKDVIKICLEQIFFLKFHNPDFTLAHLRPRPKAIQRMG